MRRVLLVVITLSLLLSACNLGGEPAANEATPAGGALPAPAADPVAEEGVVTIGFGAQEYSRSTYEPLIEAFNEQNPDVRVQFVPIDEIFQGGPDEPVDPSRWTRQIVSIADTAAVFTLQPGDVEHGYLLDLAPLMDADASFDRSDFFGAALRPTSDGGIYLLPRMLQVPVVSYNAELWAQRGLPAPAADWTWDDFVGAAEQLAQRRGDQVEVYGWLDWSNGFLMFLAELEAAGVDLFEADPNALRLDDPPFVAALERVQALAESGAIYVSDDTGFNIGDFRDMVAEQRIGMWQPQMLAGGPDQEPLPFEVGVAPLPYFAPFVFDNSQGYVISSGTQHPEASWRWIEFLSRQEIDEFGMQGISTVPARRSVAERSGYWDALDPDDAEIVRALLDRQRSATLPDVQHIQLAFETLQNPLRDVLSDSAEPVAALQEAQANLEVRLAELQLTPTPEPDRGPIVVATPQVIEAPAGATTIRFGVVGSNPAEMRELADRFNQENQERMFVEVGSPDFQGGPISLADQANQFDCFTWFSPPSGNEITTTLDLRPLIDADAAFDLEDYPAVFLEPFESGSALYGLPESVYFRTLAYNRDAFDAAGLAPPQVDWTLDDFVNAAAQLTEGSGSDARYGYASESMVQDLMFFIASSGAEVVDSSGETVTPDFTDPEVFQAIRSYIDLVRNYSPHEEFVGYKQGSFDSESFQLISEGRVGMWFTFGFFPIGGFGGRSSFTQAVAPLPLGDRALSTDDFQVRGLFISSITDQPQACWSWLKYLSTQGTRSMGSFPARRSAAEAMEETTPGAAEVYAAYTTLLERSGGATAPAQSIPRGVPLDYFWLHRAVDRALQGADLERELEAAELLTAEYLECVQAGGDGASCARQVDPAYEGFSQVPSQE